MYVFAVKHWVKRFHEKKIPVPKLLPVTQILALIDISAESFYFGFTKKNRLSTNFGSYATYLVPCLRPKSQYNAEFDREVWGSCCSARTNQIFSFKYNHSIFQNWRLSSKNINTTIISEEELNLLEGKELDSNTIIMFADQKCWFESIDQSASS